MKLDDISKKDYFTAPEGYFDSLPGRVSMRLEKKPSAKASILKYSLQYALPAFIIAIGIFWFVQPNAQAEDLLADVDTQELVSYLAEADMSYDDFLDEVNPNDEEATALEEVVFDLQWQAEEMDALLDELDNL